MKQKRNIGVIGVPMDLGAGKRGASLGPEAMRYAGFLERLESIGHTVEDRGDIRVDRRAAITEDGVPMKNVNEIHKVCCLLRDQVAEVMAQGQLPVVLGGDHSMAMGTIFGVLQQVKKLGVIWFDAHGDINTPQISPSGNVHGMPVAALLGLGIPELEEIGKGTYLDKKNLVYIGCRDLDQGERAMMKEQGVHVFTMYEIDDMGIKKVMQEALRIAGEGTDGIHVSFDMDALDPDLAPGTGTKVPGGMHYREAHYAMEMIAKSEKIVSAEFVEVNPLLDHENKTAEAAVALAGSLLGEWLI